MKKAVLQDRLLAEGWFQSEKEILPWVMAGKVLVDNQPVKSAKQLISADGEIRIKEYYKAKYVNKGGLKLEHALRYFGVDVKGKVALDCGASTGGFTDCLLRHGAKKVYAVDVGYGQLSQKLILNDAVVNCERTNISDESLKQLADKPEVITLDLSYLSLKTAIMEGLRIGKENCVLICLVKPIFEVSDKSVRQSGDINDAQVFQDILVDLCEYAQSLQLRILGVTYSPVTGNKGTYEFFLGISSERNETQDASFLREIDQAISEVSSIPKFSKNDYHL